MPDWSSYETELRFRQSIIKNAERWIQRKIPFMGLKGFHEIPTVRKTLLLKEEAKDGRDNFDNEYSIGLILNELRDYSPNFVFTYGQGINKRGRYIWLEHIPGITIGSYLGSFENLLGYVLQVIFAITFAYEVYGFTHYNLHRQNIVLRKLRRRKCIPYIVGDKVIYIETDRIPVIIDFGRSFTLETGGHTLSSRGVHSRPNHFHDIYYFLNSSLGRRFPKQLKMILKWYGVEPSDDACVVVNDLKPKILSCQELLQLCEKHFSMKWSSTLKDSPEIVNPK
jgi:hypothetical protein